MIFRFYTIDPRQIQAAITELRAELQRQREEIERQHNEIDYLRTNRPRPKATLPNPEKFNGQMHWYDTWLPSIRAKLQVDGTAIGDTVAQFYYIYLNLESHVQAIVLPQLGQAEESETWDYNTILDQLSRVYNNPNKVQEAEDKLLSLRQGTDSIPVYVSKFERVLYKARGQNWPDINKISVFRNGLSSTIQSRLHQQLNLPTSYSGFIQIVQQLASRSSSQLHSQLNLHTSSTPNRELELMEINAITLARPRARSISPARCLQYRQEGRCIRCRSHEHWVPNCPMKPFRRQTAKRTVPDRDPEGSESEWDIDTEIGKLQRGEI